MKRIVFPALLLGVCFTSLTAKAQTTATNGLSVDLAAIASITITAPATVMPAFSTAAIYQATGGSTLAVPDLLAVTASKAFVINAYSTDLTSGASPDAAHTISAAGIRVLASAGTTGTVPSSTYAGVDLNTTATNGGQTIITATEGTVGGTYSVTYTLGGSATRAPMFLNKAPGTYTATVTYTIVP